MRTSNIVLRVPGKRAHFRVVEILEAFKEEVYTEIWDSIKGNFRKGNSISKDTAVESAGCGACGHSCDGVSGAVGNEVGRLAE